MANKTQQKLCFSNSNPAQMLIWTRLDEQTLSFSVKLDCLKNFRITLERIPHGSYRWPSLKYSKFGELGIDALTKYVVGAKAKPPKKPSKALKKGNVMAMKAVNAT